MYTRAIIDLSCRVSPARFPHVNKLNHVRMRDVQIDSSRTTSSFSLSVITHQPVNSLEIRNWARGFITNSADSRMQSGPTTHNTKIGKLGSCFDLSLDRIRHIA